MSEASARPTSAASGSAAATTTDAATNADRILRLGRPLAVPKDRRDEAWQLGARYDKEERAWFAPPGSDWNALQRFEPRVENFDRWGAIEKFEAAMLAAGLEPPALTEADFDGEWHRVPLKGKRASNKAGGFKGEITQDGLRGLIRNYVDHDRPVAFSERQWTDPHVFAALQAEQRQRQAEREAALKASHEQTAREAERRWLRASKEPGGGGFRYIERKGLWAVSFGARFERRTDKLVLSASDIDGRIWSVQTINAEGDKFFCKDGRVAGCMFWIGKPVDGQPITVVEGFATGASARMALGHAVAVAFFAVNLRPVAEAIRERFPSSPMAILADNDRATEADGKKNAGVEKAKAAAEALNIDWLAPAFAPSTSFSATDWNDLMLAEGLSEVRAQCAAGLPRAFEPTARALAGPRPIAIAPALGDRATPPRGARAAHAIHASSRAREEREAAPIAMGR
ncbi:toprim domain-containing protein [Burkholderia vietnamiensis]|uniref:Toprim domain-containing protein n=1 Tax=Burkholderia vietnamiensis (strain G4 / LMG 22486) TaxID=269482 RepID=A4JFV0_BURVG|nr:domain of unknown function DUF1738 [Burkholderia vietnamiensis G4]MCB4344909.1 toprim domain-containing protein [Burkholderia vietnamiensis]